MRKRVLSVLLCATMFATLLMGCKTTQDQGGNQDGGSSVASTDTSNGEGAFPAIAKEDVKVGVIHITDPGEGAGYTYTHDQGIIGMQTSVGLADDQIVRKNNVDDGDPTATETAIRECIEEGCNIIFATSFNYMDTVYALAEEYPNILFAHGTGYKSNGKNFINYFGRIYQARYLSGIVAGMNTTTNLLGYVAAMGQDNAEVTGGINAFAMGAYSVNPDAKVYVKVTNKWFDPQGETNAAKALIDAGCDVIAQHCDTSNPQTEAEKAGVYGIGYNSDMSKDAPKATLTSAMWDWSAFYTKAVNDAINGTWTGENYFEGMKEGLVFVAPLADFCVEGTQEAVDAAKAKIEDGSFGVFDGVIETNDGSTVGEEGKTLDDATITGGINWYFKTVEVK